MMPNDYGDYGHMQVLVSEAAISAREVWERHVCRDRVTQRSDAQRSTAQSFKSLSPQFEIACH